MAIITISITESSIELVSNRPKSVTLDTSIPSTVYYTFDGSDPDDSSEIYLGGELLLPTNVMTLTFKVFATNGTDSSAIVSREYRPDIMSGRMSHDIVTTTGGESTDNFPYSTHSPEITSSWLGFGPNDSVVDKDSVSNILDGYDGAGIAIAGTDLSLDEYLIRFSESNSRGETGRGIGTLPAQVTVQLQTAPPQSSNMNDKFFDPRALVIYQDSRETPFDPDISQINRPHFSLENAEKTKDGILLDTLAIEGAPSPGGSFVRAHFNPRENTTTYYYFDSQALRWIISKEPAPYQNPREGLDKIVYSPRGAGADKVFKWVLFKGSRLI